MTAQSVIFLDTLTVSRVAWGKPWRIRDMVQTHAFQVKGSDGKVYTLRLTGPTTFMGKDDDGNNIYGFTMRLHSFTVDGYRGKITHRAQGVFYLESTGVELTMTEPTQEPGPG